MSIRRLSTALAVICAAFLLVPMAASAATGTTGTSFKNFAVTGTGKHGKKFSGHYTVTNFMTKGGKTYAVGTLTGKLGSRKINKSNVDIPTTVQPNSTTTAGTAATCPILHLVLGPLNLNLLGLHVHLNQVVLNITAVSGPGNLLGNLLCGVANLLNGSGATTTGTGGTSTPAITTPITTGLLNIVEQLVNTPALSSF